MWTKQYHDLLEEVIADGEFRDDPNREGTQRLQIPFYSTTIDVGNDFPLLTTKRMWWKGIVSETLWMLRGESSIAALHQDGVHIWDKDAVNGNIGRMYGVQWRSFRSGDKSIDQLENVRKGLIENPLSSNHVIFGDNPHDRGEQALPCCMTGMQFISDGVYLDLSINYRSWDVLLGAPWNVAQYALILHMMGGQVGLVPRFLRVNAHNVHLYDNEIEAAMEQLARNPLLHSPCSVVCSVPANWESYTLDNLSIIGYSSFKKLSKQPAMLTYTDKSKSKSK